MNDNISKLYGALKSKGYTDIGKDEYAFRDWIGKEGNVKILYGALSKNGYDDIGDEAQFTEWVGVKPQQAMANLSRSSYQPTPEEVQQYTLQNKPDIFKPKTGSLVDRAAGIEAQEQPTFEVPNVLRGITTKETVEDLYNTVGNAYSTANQIGERMNARVDMLSKNLQDPEYLKSRNGVELRGLTSSIDSELENIEEKIEARTKAVRNVNWRPGMPSSRDDNTLKELRGQRAYLNGAKELIEESQKIIQAAKDAKDGTAVGGVLRGVRDKAFDIDTWTMGLSDLVGGMRLNNILEKVEKGEKLTSAEEMLFDASVNNMAINYYYQDDLGKGYMAGQITGESLPFMLEMIINPISASGNVIAKRLLNAGLKKFAKNKAAQVGARLVGDATAAIGMSSTTGLPSIIGDTYRRMNEGYDYGVDEEGNLYANKKADAMGMGEAFARSFTTRAIENQSEMIFNAFKGMGGFMKGVEKVLPGGVNKFFDMLSHNKVADAYRWLKNSPVFRNYLVKDVRNATQIGGIFEEYAEEVYNNLANFAIGEMSWEDVVSLDKNIDTFLGLAPTQVMFGILGLGGAASMRYQTRKTLEDLQATMNEQQRKELEGLLDMGIDAKEVDVRGFIRGVMENQNYTIENKRDLIKAAYYVAQQRSIDELTEADVIDKVNAENQFIDSMTDPSTGNYAELSRNVINPQTGESEQQKGYVVGWIGEGDKRQPIFVADGMENNYANRVVLKPTEWSMDSYREMPAEQVKAVNEEMNREEAAQQAANESRWHPNVPEPTQGTRFMLETDNGIEDMTVVGVDAEQGSVFVVDSGEYRNAQGNPKKLEQLTMQAYQLGGIPMDKYKDAMTAQIEADEKAAQYNKPITNEDSVVRNGKTYTVTGVGADGVQYMDETGESYQVPLNTWKSWAYDQEQTMKPNAPSGENVGEEVNAEVNVPVNNENVQPVAEGVATEPQAEEVKQPTLEEVVATLPKTKNNEIDYKAMTPQQQYQYTSLTESPEVALEDLQADIAAGQEEIAKKQEKLSKARGGERAALRDEVRKLTQAQAELQAFYDSIAPKQEEVANEESVEPIAKTSEEAIDEPKAAEVKSEQPKVKKPKKKKSLFGQKKKDSEFTEEEMQPMNAIEFAASHLASGNIAITTESFKRETGYGEAERKKFMGMLRTPEKGGMTIEQAAEKLVSLDNEQNGHFFEGDTQAARDTIIELLGYETWGGVANLIKNNRTAERKKREEAEYAEYEAYLMEALHVTPEELELQKEYDEQNNPFQDVSEEEYFAKFAEKAEEYINYLNSYSNEQGRTDEVAGRNDSLLSEERAGDIGGNQRSESERESKEVGSESIHDSETSQESTSGSEVAPSIEETNVSRMADIEAEILDIDGRRLEIEDELNELGDSDLLAKAALIDELSRLDEQQAELQAEYSGLYNMNEESRAIIEEEGGTPLFRQKGKRAKADKKSFVERAKHWEEKTGVKIRIANSLRDVKNRSAFVQILRGSQVTGWFEESTGEVVLYMPHIVSIEEVDTTFIHEVVAHMGLRGLLGERFKEFLDEVWNMMSRADQAKYLNYLGVNGDARAAADEYIANTFETIDVTESAWSKLTELIKRFLKALGLEPKMTNADIANAIKKSYQRLLEGEESVESVGNGTRFNAKKTSDRREDMNRINNTVDQALSLVTGKDVKDVKAERVKKAQKRKEDAAEIYQSVLSGDFNNVTLQKINDYIDDATPLHPYGRRISQRLPQKLERSLHEGSRTNAVDALFSRIHEKAVPASRRTSEAGRREIEERKKEALKGWAIATNNWHTDLSEFTDEQIPIGEGTDSKVYASKDGKHVIKTSFGKPEGKRFRPDIDNIPLFNSVFRNSAYEIVGYGEFDGKFARILKQPFVEFAEDSKVSVDERVDYMRTLGFEPINEAKTAFSNGTIIVADLQKSNIVKTAQGNIRVIDADVKLHTKDVGGNYTYPPVEADLPDGTRFRMTNAEKEALRDSEESKALFDYAKKRFGRTFDLREAGYVLPDGSMLDFSGRHEMSPGSDTSFLRGNRSVDHRGIVDVAYDFEGEETGFKTDMADFLNRGAIRIDGSTGAIDLTMKPTSKQKDILRRLVQRMDGDVWIDFSEGWDSEHYVEYAGVKPMRVISDIEKYYDEGIKPEGNTRFRISNKNQEIFVSNAQRAVEGIKQEKGTPQQWLAMIEKNGGLKAGEDKWLGLSDWLKGLDKKSVTKDEILDFIGENKIQIEEVTYGENARGSIYEEPDTSGYEDITSNDTPLTENEINSLIERLENAGLEGEWGEGDFEDENSSDENFVVTPRSIFQGLLLNYSPENAKAIMVNASIIEGERNNRAVESMKDINPINSTRLEYTTEGLENKAEIALTVPTIEPWNKADEIHFGDAGEGRAIAWVRFGETRGVVGETESVDAYLSEMRSKYNAAEGEEVDFMSEDEIKHLQSLTSSEIEAKGNAPRILVIDEIQSKRHQEGREKGYKSQADKTPARMEDLTFGEYNGLITATYKGERLYFSKEKSKEEILEMINERIADGQLGNANNLIPDAPFEKNWSELAMKRMLRYAAENGYDKVAWTTGAQQAERYNISKFVDNIRCNRVGKNGNKSFVLEGVDYNVVANNEGVVVAGSDEFKGKQLSEIVGGSLAGKMLKMEEGDVINNTELRIGGEGMKGFYDKMLPSFVNKYVKKWGTKVQDIELPNVEEAGRIMHSVDVTDAMKESVMEGQTMFRVVKDPAVDYISQAEDVVEVPREKVMYTMNNIANQLYKVSGRFMRKLYKYGTIGRVLKGEYAEIDQIKAKREYDHAKPIFDEYLNELVWMKYQSTEAAQEVINDVISDVEYAMQYYKDLALGKDVWRTKNSPRFRISEKHRKDVSKAIADFTSSYNSKPVSYITNDMTDEQVDDLLEGYLDSEDVQRMKNEGAHGFYLRKTDRIYIFVDDIPLEAVENSMFHENLHLLLGSNNPLTSVLWDKVKDESAKFNDALKKIYKPHELAEEYFVYKMAKGLTEGEVETFISDFAETDKEALFNILKTLGYEYESESRERRGRRIGGIGNALRQGGKSSERRSGESREALARKAETRKGKLQQLFGRVADLGLDGVLGNKEYVNAMVDMYKVLPEAVQREVADEALSRYGGDVAPAVSDWLNHKAEASVWDKVVAVIREALRKVGFDLDLNTNEAKYILWRSQKPLNRNNLLELAEDIDMKNRLKVGEYEDSPTRFRSIEEVNYDYNRRLDELDNDRNQKDRVLRLGKPGRFLTDGGVSGSEIEMEFDKFVRKSNDNYVNDHPFTAGDIKNLPKAINSPIAVFDSTNHKDKVILTELKKEDNNFIVVIKATQRRRKGGVVLEVNEISTLYPKNAKGIIKWINDGLITNVDKRKALDWLGALHTHRGTGLINQELDSATKIVESFENPKVEGENVRKNGGGTRFRVDVGNKLNIRDEYEATIKKGGFQAREAVQDAMLSLRRFQELIEKVSGKKIRDFENAWMHENRLSSVVQAQIHEMERKFYKPMMNAVKKLMAVASIEQEQVADYLMLKHGIERNREMAVRKALTDSEGKIDRTRLEQWYQDKRNVRSRAATPHLDTWRKQQEELDNIALMYGADMSRDYSGLTSMFGTDDLADSTQQAYDEVEALEKAHPAETEALGKAIKAMTQNTLDESFGSGLMDRKVYDELSKDMYDYYIPLRGFDETTSEEVYAYLDQDRGAFNAPLKRAKGRSSKSDNPIAYLKSIAESGIMQGERNKMKQSFLNLVINNPSDLVSVREGVWVIYNPASGEWEAAAPPAIPNNATPADVEAAMEAWEANMESLAASDPNVKKVSEAQDIPYRVVGNRMNQHQVIVKRLGKSYTLTINGNPRLAMALNGLTNPNNKSNDGKVAAYVSGKIDSLNRTLSAWYTARNPDFVASNFMRDTFYTNTIVRAKEGNAYANKFHKNYGKVLPQMLILFSKYEKGTLNPADKTEAAFLDFMMNGGETGYSNLKDLEHIKKQIAKDLKGNRFAKVEALAEKLDILNRAVENTARFAAFLTSREEGRSIAKSVFDAKEISVNFNKKGAGGTFFGMTGQTGFGNLAAMVGAGGRALYVFFSAAVQGTTNLMHVMKVNPKGTSAGLAAMFLMGAVVPFLFGGDDDDEKDYYDLPEHVRRNHLIIPGAGDVWISIPLPIEYRIMYGMGELLSSWRTGHERGSDIARKMLNLTGQALPLNFLEEGLDAFVPSAISPIWQVYNNRSWTGLPIYKDNEFNKDDPEYTKAFKNTDRGLVKFTKALYEWTFDEDNQEEGLDLNPAVIETLAKGYFGGLATQLSNIMKVGGMIAGEQEFDWRNIPIGNRILKTGDERTKGKRVTNEYFENMEKLDFLQSRERMLKKVINGPSVPQTDKDKAKIDDEIMRGSDVYKKYQEFKTKKKEVDKIRKTIKEKGSTPELEKKLMDAQEAANKAVR